MKAVSILLAGIILLGIFISKNVSVKEGNVITNLPVIFPTPFEPFPYKIPPLPVKRSYLTYIVGDSMVEALGGNAESLRQELLSRYPENEFVNYNYGFGSTNIGSLNERLTKETTYQGTKFPPILTQGFDLIIIESFAYNPLFEGSLDKSLLKYDELLEKNIKEIIKARPDSVVAIMTPIAPNRENFAKYSRDLSPEVRMEWVREREMYIKRAVEFANKNNIPLIDVYEKTKLPDGNGDLKYIDPTDFIHPSKEGVKIMAETIAEFIFKNSIFPRSEPMN
jgi:lysophospholipase L1-like esterase